MTLEEIIECPSLWEALTPAEQEAFFAPMLNVTRPERESAVHKESQSNKPIKEKKMSEAKMRFSQLSPEKQAQMRMFLDEEGIEL